MKWYKVKGHEGHVGTEKSREAEAYIFATDVMDAWDKFKEINGIRSKETPSISELSEKEKIDLERRILSEGISLEHAKKDYYSTNVS